MRTWTTQSSSGMWSPSVALDYTIQMKTLGWGAPVRTWTCCHRTVGCSALLNQQIALSPLNPGKSQWEPLKTQLCDVQQMSGLLWMG